jgi:hypothetical protein
MHARDELLVPSPLVRATRPPLTRRPTQALGLLAASTFAAAASSLSARFLN